MQYITHRSWVDKKYDHNHMDCSVIIHPTRRLQINQGVSVLTMIVWDFVLWSGNSSYITNSDYGFSPIQFRIFPFNFRRLLSVFSFGIVHFNRLNIDRRIVWNEGKTVLFLICPHRWHFACNYSICYSLFCAAHGRLGLMQRTLCLLWENVRVFVMMNIIVDRFMSH